MILKDIKVGEEYGALDNPASRRSRYGKSDLPRQVKVLGIVTVPVRQWDSWTRTNKSVNKQRIKVKLLGPPQDGYTRYDIANGKQNRILVIESRQVVVLWSEIAGEVAAKIAAKNEKDLNLAKNEKRVRALIGRTGEFRINADTDDLRFFGNAVEKILALAEKGKAAK